MKLKFVVVGSGRSATKYISKIFSQLGITCGHESYRDTLNPGQYEVASSVVRFLERGGGGMIGEASFAVVPFLDRFDGTVFHQVRHPLSVLRSVMSTRFFLDPGPYARYLDLIENILPEITQIESPLRKAIHFIVGWNSICESFARLRWKVEDIDAQILTEAARMIGVSLSLVKCKAVLERTPIDINGLERHGLNRLNISWYDIPDSQEKIDLYEMTIRYGYKP